MSGIRRQGTVFDTQPKEVRLNFREVVSMGVRGAAAIHVVLIAGA
jgi:hypothetical protein